MNALVCRGSQPGFSNPKKINGANVAIWRSSMTLRTIVFGPNGTPFAGLSRNVFDEIPVSNLSDGNNTLALDGLDIASPNGTGQNQKAVIPEISIKVAFAESGQSGDLFAADLFPEMFEELNPETADPDDTRPTLLVGRPGVSIVGSDGDDNIRGNFGPDSLSGSGGNDVIAGSPPIPTDDLFFGGRFVFQTSETGLLVAQDQNQISGGDGDDTLNGFGTLSGDAGNDNISGSGNLNGNDGDDTIRGSGHIEGGTGDDRLEGGPFINGGEGSDTISSTSSDEIVTLEGGMGDDLIHFINGDRDTNAIRPAAANIKGGDGNDHITTSADFIDAGDSFTGTSSIEAGLGDDTIDAGLGDYSIDAGGGNDLIFYRPFNETINGDPVNTDFLGGVSAIDTLLGGAGNDTLDIGSVLQGSAAVGRFSDRLSLIIDLENESIRGLGFSSADILLDEEIDLAAISGIENITGEGSGTGNDTVIGDAADNVLIFEGNDTVIHGRDGNDTLSGGAAGENTLFGEMGDDSLTGGSEADSLSGGDGSDTLTGGAGDDTLDGGAGIDAVDAGSGNDLIISDLPLPQALGGPQTIDGGEGIDLLDLSGVPVQTDRVTIDLGSPLADFSMQQELLVGIAQVAIVNGIENVIATNGNDRIFGAQNSAFLSGLAGDDTIILRAINGSGEYLGGSGVDTLILPGDSGAVNIDLDNGSGVLFGAALSGFENIEAGDGDDTLGGDDNPNRLIGGGGDDVFSDVDADDTIDGGSGTDFVDFSSSQEGVTVDLVANTGVAVNIEAITGSDTGDDHIRLDAADNRTLAGGGNDTLMGEDGNDTLFGQSGNDSLSGQGGRDSINGGSGDDTLDGGDDTDFLDGGNGDDLLIAGRGFNTLFSSAGNDTFDGSADNFDTVNFLSETGGVTVDLDAGTGTDGTGGRDSFIDIEEISGSHFDDSITGDGDSNVLFGHDGDDTLSGGSGNQQASEFLDGGAGNDVLITSLTASGVTFGGASDTLVGGAGLDTFVIRNTASQTIRDFDAAGGEVIDLSHLDDLFVSFADVQAAASDGPSVEIALGGGNALVLNAVTLSELSEDNFVFADASSGPNVINGTANEDTLTGTSDDDIINALASDDTISGLGQNDTVNGGDGFDTVDYSAAAGAVTINLATNVNSGLAAGQILNDVEAVVGTAFDDSLTGSEAPERLVGGSGNDLVNGGAGDDTLGGGEGDDTLTGGDGADRFLIADGGSDRVTDFTAGDGDIIDLSDTDTFALSAVQATADTVITLGNGETLTLENVAANTLAEANFVFAGNTAPTATGDQLQGVQNQALSLRLEDIGFADADGDAFAGLTITSVPDAATQGILRVNGVAVSAGAVITPSQLSAGLVDFVPVAGGTFTIGFTVSDGHADSDPAALTVSVTTTGNTGGGTGGSGSSGGSSSGDGGSSGDGSSGGGSTGGSSGGDNADTDPPFIVRDDDGNTTVTGRDEPEVFNGGEGVDIVDLAGGNDETDAGGGDDTVRAGDGDDTVRGGSGSDFLRGDDGHDRIAGGSGDDRSFAGPDDTGNDTVEGNAGNDVIGAGAGDDIIVGGDIGDDITGGNAGNAGSDTLFGGAGDDLIVGGSFNTATNTPVNTGEGNNLIFSGAGNDTIFGDDADDILGGGNGNDIITGGAGTDIIFGGVGGDGDNEDTLNGGDGDDRIFASADEDFVDGGAGADLLFGGQGDDTVAGGSGNDTIYGGADDDTITGGEGDDTFSFITGFGRDTIGDFGMADGDRDTLDFSEIEDLVLSDIQASATFTDGNAILTIGTHGTVILTGINEAQLQSIFDSDQVLI